MPTVSVIIPNYNHAPYLTQRIESVLNQTYQDFEVIILDDKSTDNSRDIIEQYRNHPKVSHIIYNEENSGSTFKQWKKGIELAKGEWIWIAESDDWCEPILLENLIIDDDNYAISYCQSYYYYENINTIKVLDLKRNIFQSINKEDFIQKRLLPNNLIFNASMAIFRKEFFNNISEEYTKYKFCGDWIFWAEISQFGKVYECGKYLNFFRKHNSDVTGNVIRNGYNFIEELNTIEYFNKKFGIDRKFIKTSLETRYLKYLERRVNFSDEVNQKINNLFEKCLTEEELKHIKIKNDKKILKQKINSILKKIYAFF